ncbi:MAG: NUDIX domain-containing protein [Pseudomonadota bacterium]
MHRYFRDYIAPWIIQTLFHRYWRFTRAATLGAQGVILDEANRVLLVRHTYRPGWHFPGGGVEYNETFEQALKREVAEETGVVVRGDPKLHGVFANFKSFPGDHIAVFIVRDWARPSIPEANAEISEQGFFALSNLPETLSQGTRNRLTEILQDKPVDVNWA